MSMYTSFAKFPMDTAQSLFCSYFVYILNSIAALLISLKRDWNKCYYKRREICKLYVKRLTDEEKW